MRVKPARGIQRITYKEVKARADDAAADTKAHIKQCYICKRAGKDLYRRCDVGWNLAKVSHRAAMALEQWHEDVSEVMDQLW